MQPNTHHQAHYVLVAVVEEKSDHKHHEEAYWQGEGGKAAMNRAENSAYP